MASVIGKFRKATEKEKQAWKDEKLNLYPLRGFIIYNNLELAVEKPAVDFLKFTRRMDGTSHLVCCTRFSAMIWTICATGLATVVWNDAAKSAADDTSEVG
jgi:hypothetical protein